MVPAPRRRDPDLRICEKENRTAYAYLCKGMTIRHEKQKCAIERANDENLTGAKIFDELQKQGVFVIVLIRKVMTDKLLSMYYMCDQVEKYSSSASRSGRYYL